MKLSIVIPAFDEEKTIYQILDKINKTKLIRNTSKEIILINDCSKDGTEKELKRFKKDNKVVNLKYLRNKKNLGKGACLKKGFKKATGDYIIVQDADLEYEPKDYNKILYKISQEKALVVYGSRYLDKEKNKKLVKWHTQGNQLLTKFFNIFSKQNLTDVHTCYKCFHKDILSKVKLKENGFAFCPEVTAKILNLQEKIYEVPISYNRRDYKQGKKIRFKDALRAFYADVWYNLFG